MKIKFILISAIVLIISSAFLVGHYLNLPQNKYKAQINQLENLIKNGISTQAIYDSTYEELKRKGHTEAIFINFSYFVDNKQYRQKANLTSAPKSLTFEIFYLPENPNIYSRNPQEDYNNAKESLKNEIETPTINWIVFLSSICVLVYMIISLRNEIKLDREFKSITDKYK
jgi:hypothetical protein